MKNNLRLFIAACLLSMVTISCDTDKLTEDLDIVVNADVIRYSVLLQVNDATGEIPSDLTISVSGADADYIYDIAGNKKLEINNGIITLGVHPRHEPTDSHPVSFDIKLSGSDYLETTIPVTMYKNQFYQVKSSKMLKLSHTPATVTVADETFALQNNSTPAEDLIVTSPRTTETPEVTQVRVPAGTMFLNTGNTKLIGESLNIKVVNYNTASVTTASLFPNQQFNAYNVTSPTNTSISAFFLPAGFASVNMQVDGTEVKNFNQPIQVSIELNPEFKLLNSTTPIASGDKIKIWSYSEDTGKWQYEGEATIAVVDGKPLVSFTTNHLTVYSAAEYVETTNCQSPVLTFNANWLNNDTETFTVQVWNDELTHIYSSNTVVVSNGKEETLRDLPTFAVRYEVLNIGNEEVANGRIDNPCTGGNQSVVIPTPATPTVGITLSLTVKCPDKGTVTPPDFYLLYKPAGAPKADYKLLGVVSKGSISTTLLQIGNRYDFIAQWGSKDKFVGNHLINSKDMSTTVGLNDNLGSVTPDQNRNILIEECSRFY